jgi:hypothetical protein
MPQDHPISRRELLGAGAADQRTLALQPAGADAEVGLRLGRFDITLRQVT